MRTRSGAPDVAGRLHRLERVLVRGEVVVARSLVEPDHRGQLWQQDRQDASLHGQPQRLRRVVAHEQLAQLVQSGAADALLSQPVHGVGVLAHLRLALSAQVVAQRRHEPQRPQDPQRVVTERRRVRRVHEAVLQVVQAPAGRVEDRRVSRRADGADVEVQRVEREVAALGVLPQREVRVHDDLEVLAAGAGADLRARHGDLDEAQPLLADAPADLSAVAQLERRAGVRPHGAQAHTHVGEAEAADHVVGILARAAEQLVAHGTADAVRLSVQALHENVYAVEEGHRENRTTSEPTAQACRSRPYSSCYA
jgi:hypothetical protein